MHEVLWLPLSNISGELYAKCISIEHSPHFIPGRKYADLVPTK